MRRKSSLAGKKKPAAKKKESKLKSEEVTELLDQVQAEEKSERTWKEMTAADSASDEADPIAEVEENLIKKPHESHHKDRTWKYYGK